MKILIFLLSIIKFISSASIQGKVIITPFVNDKNALVPTLKEENLSVEITGPVTKMVFTNIEGEFAFLNIPEGHYLIKVNNLKYDYETYLLDVTDGQVNAFQRNFKTGKGLKVKYPLQIKPSSIIIYEEESQSIVSSIIKSPYMIIIGMTLLMFVCMNMVPKEELDKQMKQMNKQMHQMKQGNTSFS